MEIISGVERRLRWRCEDKLRILAEIDGGAKLNYVARRHDVSRGLLWQWREAQRRGRLVFEEPSFVPVRVVGEPPPPERGDAGDGVDEERLDDLALGLEPEDGRLWVYGPGEEATLAFTRAGVELLEQIIADAGR